MEQDVKNVEKSSEVSKEMESDSEDDSLRIDIAKESPKKSGKKAEFDGRELDKTIEETLEKCKNITPDAAKKMLLKLIKNEHILALTLLKAEEQTEQEKQEQNRNSSGSDDEEAEAPATPKLTRLKAKQLNQQLPIPGSLTPEPCEDFVAMINEELKSDDEDDEYRPEHEVGSDEDANTTFSDIESQPSTPGSALLYNEQDVESPEKDGEFKVPRTRTLSAQEQENISRRTRSKLCLSLTPIETIQSTFIPPDITIDMYDMDQEHEIDNEWKEFLNEFMLPLTNVEEDDEKSDPEYVASEAVPVDKEELRPVRVSKKELNQLISELLEDSCNSFTFDPEPSTSSKRSSTDGQQNRNKRPRINSPMIGVNQLPKNQTKPDTDTLNTPTRLDMMGHASTPQRETPDIPSEIIDATLINPYYQQQLMTPQRPGFLTPNIMQSPVVVPSPFPTPTLVQDIGSPAQNLQITGVYGSNNCSIAPAHPPPILIVNSQNQLEVHSQYNLINQAFNNNGTVQLPQFQSVVVQVPTIDLLQNNFRVSVGNQALDQTASEELHPDLVPQNLTDCKKKKLTSRKDKLRKFEYLEHEEPPDENLLDKDSKGLTFEQKKIYEQQMRQHAQLLSQNYLQIYANPKWWDKAEPIKNNLIELKKVVKTETSPIVAEHIAECLKMCNFWEAELEENNERNKSYADYLYQEHDLDERAFEKQLPFKPRFHPRFMEHVLNSKAIVYPRLLPETPFRAVTFHKVEPPPSELKLFAIGLERFQREKFERLNSFHPYKIRHPKLSSVVKCIAREYCSFRPMKSILKIIENYSKHPKMNPIKYYHIHKKAPAINHETEEAPVKFVAPKHLMRGLLPRAWDMYKFSYERLQIHPFISEEDINDEPLESIIEPEIAKFIVPTPEIEVLSADEANNSFKIVITCSDIPNFNFCVVPRTAENLVEEPTSCVDLCSPIKVREKSAEEKQNNLISILKKVTDNLEKGPKAKKSVNFLLPSPVTTRSSSRFKEKLIISKQIANTFLLSQKFFIVIESFFNDYTKHLQFRNGGHPLLIRTFNWTKTIDIYASLVNRAVMMSKKRANEAAAAGSTDTATKAKKGVSSSEEFSKKLNRKLSENRELIMQNNRNKCTVEKDCSYAYNYLERVKKTLNEHGDDELYSEFMSMLTSFNPDSESVPELYNKIESLLLPNYAELVDLFLSFLLPEHAVEIGKFFEHFVLSSMSNLLQKLNAFFSKQPTHMKRVIAVLNELSNEQDVTMDRMKTRIFPLLKGNQLLIDWFTELFDKPMNSLPSEFESVYIKKSLSDSDNSVDNYEEIHSTDLIECGNIEELNSCGVKYKNGKIFYQGTLLPAKISFLAHDAPPVLSLKTDENLLCMHEIRKHVKFLDPKKTEEVVEADETTKSKEIEFKLCDTETLHAHAVRLNSVHAQNGEKLSDLVSLLSPSSCGSNDEQNMSPKKTKNVKKISPKKKSPSSTGPSPAQPTSPSKALQTAKKLRNLLADDSIDEHSKKKMKLADSSEAHRPKATKSGEKRKSKAEKMSENPSSKITKANAAASTSRLESNVERAASKWTREEDKQILEALQKGFESNEDMLDVLVVKLSRNRSEINHRYEYLLDIIGMHNDAKAPK